MQALWRGGLKASRLDACELLGAPVMVHGGVRPHRTPQGLRAYGAGILSRPASCATACAAAHQGACAFDLQRLMRNPAIASTATRPTYFVIDAFQQLSTPPRRTSRRVRGGARSGRDRGWRGAASASASSPPAERQRRPRSAVAAPCQTCGCFSRCTSHGRAGAGCRPPAAWRWRREDDVVAMPQKQVSAGSATRARCGQRQQPAAVPSASAARGA